MKSFLSFIKTTITGGVLFLLPVVLLIIIFGKALNILRKLSAPISEKLPTIIFGLDGSNLVAIALLILICFLSGLLFRSKFVRKWIKKLEDDVLIHLPGYVLIKSITAGAMGEKSDDDMLPVLIRDDETWNLAFLVEKGEKFSTVFIPDAPRHDAGEVKIIPTNRIEKLDISVNKFTQSIKTYGKGSSKWVK
jgi:uncharacterized membrane protein